MKYQTPFFQSMFHYLFILENTDPEPEYSEGETDDSLPPPSSDEEEDSQPVVQALITPTPSMQKIKVRKFVKIILE